MRDSNCEPVGTVRVAMRERIVARMSKNPGYLAAVPSVAASFRATHTHTHTCSRALMLVGKSSKTAFTPTRHSPLGFSHSSGMWSVRPVSPSTTLPSPPSVFRTVEVSTSPQPVVSMRSTILRWPSVVSYRMTQAGVLKLAPLLTAVVNYRRSGNLHVKIIHIKNVWC